MCRLMQVPVYAHLTSVCTQGGGKRMHFKWAHNKEQKCAKYMQGLMIYGPTWFQNSWSPSDSSSRAARKRLPRVLLSSLLKPASPPPLSFPMLKEKNLLQLQTILALD